MNLSELIELSKAAAKVAGIDPDEYADHCDIDIWLHEDNARCFALMCRYGLEPSFTEEYVYCLRDFRDFKDEYYTSHDDREQATRVALLRAIVAIGEQK